MKRRISSEQNILIGKAPDLKMRGLCYNDKDKEVKVLSVTIESLMK